MQRLLSIVCLSFLATHPLTSQTPDMNPGLSTQTLIPAAPKKTAQHHVKKAMAQGPELALGRPGDGFYDLPEGEWLAFVSNGEKATIRKAIVHSLSETNQTNMPIIDGAPSEKVLFMVRGMKDLMPGSEVPAWKEVTKRNFNNDKYNQTFTTSSNKFKILGLGTPGEIYSKSIVMESPTGETVSILELPKTSNEKLAIGWVGDINGDGIPDVFCFTTTESEEGTDVNYLLLLSANGKLKWKNFASLGYSHE